MAEDNIRQFNRRRRSEEEASDRESDRRNGRRVARRKPEKVKPYIDFTMLFSLLLLLVLGLVMIYSTTAYKSGISEFKSHLVAVVIGLVLMIIVSVVPFKNIPFIGTVAIFVAIGSVLMLFTPLKITLNNATRWFKLFGFSVQSAEIVKLCLIFVMAKILSGSRQMFGDWKIALIIYLLPVFMAGFLGKVSSNFSSAIIIVLICYVMIFVADPRSWPYLVLTLVGIIVVAIVVAGVTSGNLEFGFRSARIILWLDPEATVDGKDAYQTLQGLYAIGSGGFWGKGIGEGIQKINKIPEAQNDMIYTVLCEELGFVGAALVIMLFLLLVTRLFILAQNAASKFDMLLITGVMAQIAVQAILNIAVVTNSIPNTGVSLPFISSGGSSVMFLLIEFGMVINVSRFNRLSDAES